MILRSGMMVKGIDNVGTSGAMDRPRRVVSIESNSVIIVEWHFGTLKQLLPTTAECYDATTNQWHVVTGVELSERITE